MAFTRARSCPRRLARRPRRSGLCAGSCPRAAVAADQQVVVRRPVRQVRSRPAAARLQGLPRGLPAMSRHAAALVPQPRRAGRPRLLDRAGGRGRGRIQVSGGRRRPGRADRARRAHRRPFPAAAACKFPGATPPDLSVIAKARGFERGFPRWVLDMFTQYQEQGPDYLTALMPATKTPPAGVDAAARRVLQQISFPATSS